MQSKYLNYFIDLFLALSFIVVLITGFIKLPIFVGRVSVNLTIISAIHDISGIAMGALSLLHVILHWKWIVTLTKNIFKKDNLQIKIVAIFSMIITASVIVFVIVFFILAFLPLNNGHSKTAISYNDGDYFGKAPGYQSYIHVKVTIKSGKIEDVSVLKHNETQSYFRYVVKYIPPAIIKYQTTNVDSVSGATISSDALLTAVNLALDRAKK